MSVNKISINSSNKDNNKKNPKDAKKKLAFQGLKSRLKETENASKIRNASRIFGLHKIWAPINIFDTSNLLLRRSFFFFFMVAICSYLSLMFSNTPYKDDFHRYLANTGVGTISALRIVTFCMEFTAYLSGIDTDAAPFTQILSCAVLAYSAVICLKIFRVNFQQKWEILCFVPVVVNPYLLDVMMFRFDNFFIVSALFVAIFAAYLSFLNQEKKKIDRNKRLLLASITLLFSSLFIYQAASFVYLLIFTYFFMLRISEGQSFLYALREMWHWILTLVVTLILYMPLTKFIAYLKLNDSSALFLIPRNLENIKIVLRNFADHFQQLWNGWTLSLSGNFCIVVSLLFIAHLIYRTFKNTKSFLYSIFVLFLIVVFFLSPSGIYYFMYIVDYQKRCIDPRIMYSMGVLLSLLLLNNYRLMQQIQKSWSCSRITDIFGCIVGLFCIWNVLWANSVGKIFAESFKVQNHIFHDAAVDISKTVGANEKIRDLLFLGKAKYQKIKELESVFPLVMQLSSGGWDYSKTALLNNYFAEKLMSSREDNNAYVINNAVYIVNEDNNDSNDSNRWGDYLDGSVPLHTPKIEKIKKSMWYETFHLDEQILLIKLRDKARDDNNRKHPITRLK